MSTQSRSSRIHPVRQRGVALLVVLILLLVMTLLGLASLRGSLMEERMSAGLYDRSLGFQATEAALREAEALVAGGATFPASGCLNGLCAQRIDMASTDLVRWLDPATPWRNSTVTLAVDSDGDGTSITTTPQFIVEQMGEAPNWPGCDRELPINPSCVSPRFRVTARSNEANRAQVLLQSTVSTP